MAKALDIIQEVIDSKGAKELRVNATGELEASVAGTFDKMKKFFGAGEFAAKKVADYFKGHSDELFKAAEESFLNHKSIAPIQKAIKEVFKDAGMIDEMPDVVTHVFSNWMDKLPDDVKGKPIRELFLPGTHDSMATSVDWSKPIQHNDASNKEKLLEFGSKALNYIPGVNNIVENWTVTQNQSISEQLEHGIRLFDIRVSFNESDQKFYTSHTFTIAPLEEILDEFASFLKEHPKEAAVIKISPDYIHRKSMVDHHNDLGKFIENHPLGSMLVSRQNKDISLKEVAESHKNAVVIYSGSNLAISSKIWEKSSSNEIWLDKDDLDKELEALEQKFDDTYISKKAYSIDYTSFVVTPSASTIFTNSSLASVSEELNSHISEFMDNHSNIADKISGIAMDFPSDGNIEALINVNMTHDIYHHA